MYYFFNETHITKEIFVMASMLPYLPIVPIFGANIDTYGNASHTSDKNKKYNIGIIISSQGYGQ